MDNYYEGVPTGAPPRTGWLVFAATVLVVSGIFKIFDALWAFKYDDELSPEVQTFLFEHDLASWGWVWLIVGIVLIVVGLLPVMIRDLSQRVLEIPEEQWIKAQTLGASSPQLALRGIPCSCRSPKAGDRRCPGQCRDAAR